MERCAAAKPDDQSDEGFESPSATGFEVTPSDDLSGRPFGGPLVLGDYILEEQIGHGGMGVIYRARQVSLARTVAVKLLLLGRYSSPDSIRRFHREAQAAAALRHPNIVSVFEVGECEGQPFLAMEYVDGPSLAAVMKRGRCLRCAPRSMRFRWLKHSILPTRVLYCIATSSLQTFWSIYLIRFA